MKAVSGVYTGEGVGLDGLTGISILFSSFLSSSDNGKHGKSSDVKR